MWTVAVVTSDNSNTIEAGSSPGTRLPATVETVCRLALNNPGLGQYVVSRRLRELGISLTPAEVRSIWRRHGLETCEKRVRALIGGLATEDELPGRHRFA